MISDELLKIVLDKMIDNYQEERLTSLSAFLKACDDTDTIGIVVDRVPNPYGDEVRLWVNVVSGDSYLSENDDEEVSLVVENYMYNSVIFTNPSVSPDPIIDDHIISKYIIPLDHPLVAEHVLRLEMLTL